MRNSNPISSLCANPRSQKLKTRIANQSATGKWFMLSVTRLMEQYALYIRLGFDATNGAPLQELLLRPAISSESAVRSFAMHDRMDARPSYLRPSMGIRH